MRLAEWMKRECQTCESLAAAVDCDVSTISRLIPKDGKKQTRRPSISLAERISQVTHGEVTANDFIYTDDRPADNPAHSAKIGSGVALSDGQ